MLHELIALVALTAMEIVLGIDNVVFISVTSAKLPPEQRKRAQQEGRQMAAVEVFGRLMRGLFARLGGARPVLPGLVPRLLAGFLARLLA